MTTPTPKNSLSEARTFLKNRDIGKESEKPAIPLDGGNFGFSADSQQTEAQIFVETEVLESKDVEDSTSGSDQEPEDESRFLHGWSLTTLMTALMAAVFMVALDSSIIATAIPRITSEFGRLYDVAWYGSSYLLTQMSMQPTFGRIFTFFNMKWTYIGAFLIFEVGSIICAAASTSTVFIIGRALAGVGAAGMFCGGLLIIAHAVPKIKRPLYMSTVSTMYGIAAVAGPLLGGLITDSKKLTWRFCFWLNVPFGVLAMAGLIWIFKEPKTPHSDLTFWQKIVKLDFLSAFILTGLLVCLLLALQYGGLVYPWSDARVWGCLLGFALLTIVFVGMQYYKKENAVIPIRIISQRTVAISFLFKAFLQVAMMAQAYYVPIYFQAVRSLSAQDSGLRTLIFGVTIAIATLAAGYLVTRLGYYVPFMFIGAAIFALGSGLLTTLKLDSGPEKWLSYQLVAGIGYGVPSLMPFYALQAVLSDEDVPTANALIMFSQCLGGSLGLSIAQNIFSSELVKGLRGIDGVDVQMVVNAGASDVVRVVEGLGVEVVQKVLEAYNGGLTKAFWLAVAGAGLAMVCSFGIENRNLKGKKQ